MIKINGNKEILYKPHEKKFTSDVLTNSVSI